MDFVVVGLGLGTLAMLGGVLLLGWLAGRWERTAARASRPDDAAHDNAMAVWRRDSGQALLGAGSAVLLATIGALAGSLTDQTGAFLVTTTATVAALGLLFWAYLYRARHPVPPRRRALTSEPAPRPIGPAIPASVVAAPLVTAPPADTGASGPHEADPAPEEPAVAASVPAAALEEAPDPAAPDTAPIPDDAGDTPPPATSPDAAEPAPDDAITGETASDHDSPEAPKIVELAAFAARAEKSRAASGTDEGDG